MPVVAVAIGASAAWADSIAPSRAWYVARNGPPGWRLLERMAESIEFSEVRSQVGDDPRWAQAAFDDSAWPVIARGKPPYVPTHAGIMWLRFRVRWTSPTGHLPEGLNLLFLTASYDLYWDGVRIGENGVPGNSREEEVEGLIECQAALSPAMTGPGEHLLAMRLSSYHTRDPGGYSPLVTIVMAPSEFEAGFRRDNVLPIMACGALFTIALAALVMWLIAARRRVLLLFSGMCFCGGLMELARWYALAYVYPYSWQYDFELVVAGAGLALSLCLAAVMIDEWRVPRGRWWLAAVLVGDGILAVHAAPQIYYLAAQFIGVSIWFVLGCCVWAAMRRKPSVWAVAAAVGTSGVLLWDDPSHFVGLDFFQRFLPTTLGVLLAIALRLRAERRQVQETRLTAARLEIELLKKNLQPHFLMNTLTALAQTVEEEPTRAVNLIDDLAQEFRTLARVSGERTVSLAEELELCRAHLRVMQARTDVAWRLDVDGVDVAAGVPPALFLTLIENGFSHQRARKDDATFTLRAAALDRGVRYTFRSPGEVTAETNRVKGGTGMRYVRARLEESFPGAWRLDQGEVDGGWETVIELRDGAPKPGAA